MIKNKQSIERLSNNMEILTLDEVAEMLNLRVSTIRKYCREGKIPCIKIGKSYRIDKKDLIKFLNRRKQETKSKLYKDIWED